MLISSIEVKVQQNYLGSLTQMLEQYPKRLRDEDAKLKSQPYISALQLTKDDTILVARQLKLSWTQTKCPKNNEVVCILKHVLN